MPPLSRSARALAATAASSLLLALAPVVPAAAQLGNGSPEVSPTTVKGNPSCPDGTVSLKNDQPITNSVISGTVDGEAVSVSLFYADDTYTEMAFQVDGPALMSVFIAKAGPEANLYDYRGFPDGGIVADDGLVTPQGKNDSRYALSHGDFCLVPAPSDLVAAVDVDEQVTPASAPEPGGSFDWTVTVTNTGDVELGDITLVDSDPSFDALLQASCGVVDPLPAGASFTCAYTTELMGEPGDDWLTDVTVSGLAADGTVVTATDAASPYLEDVLPSVAVTTTPTPSVLPAETGGSVTWDVTVTNTSDEDLTILSLDDTLAGSLLSLGDCVSLGGATLSAGQSSSCSYDFLVPGAGGATELPGSVTVVGQDNEGNAASDLDTWTLSYEATPREPIVAVDVTETPSPAALFEPGGVVIWTVDITNTGEVELVVTGLVDAVYGDLDGVGTCVTGQSVPVGATVSCTYPADVIGEPGDTLVAPVTVTALGNGQTVTADDAQPVTILDVLPAVEVDKAVAPTEVVEPSATVTWSVSVTNTSDEAATLTALTDDRDGHLDGQGSCAIGGVVPAGGTYGCTYQSVVSGSPGDVVTGTVTGTLADDDGNAASDAGAATVTITDSPATLDVVKTASADTVTEAGADVTWTVVATNTSDIDTISLTEGTDTLVGNLADVDGCSLPVDLAPGASYTCTYTTFVSGVPGSSVVNTATLAGVDDENNPISASGTDVVGIVDVPGAIAVVKTVAPDSIAEPGGQVEWVVTVTNTSELDAVTLDSVSDDQAPGGDLLALCPTSDLAPGQAFTCTYATDVAGVEGDTISNTVLVAATDDDGTPLTGQDTATVTIAAPPAVPAIAVVEAPTPTTLPEPGGTFAWDVLVTNTGNVDLTLTGLVDDVYGDVLGLDAGCDGVLLAPGASVLCAYDATFFGNAGDIEQTTVTATGTAPDGAIVTATHAAPISLTDVASAILVTKTVDPTSVVEPGGTVTWTVTARNSSTVDTVELTSAMDSQVGQLLGSAACDGQNLDAQLAPGEAWTCVYTTTIDAADPDAVVVNTVDVVAVDDDGEALYGTDTAAVTVQDSPSDLVVTKTASATSLPEPGGQVTWTVTITNTSAVDAVTLDSIDDTLVGDLTAMCPELPTTLAAGEPAQCRYSTEVTGDTTNTVVVSATDDDGNGLVREATASVDVTDVLPSIVVTELASPAELGEPGGDVTWTVTVANLSVEPVTLTSLVDTTYGDLVGQGDCALVTIAVGDAYTCSYTTAVVGDPGDVFGAPVTAVAVDDEGNAATDDGLATVTLTDVPSSIAISKDVDVASQPEPGGDVVWTITVTNTSAVDAITLDTLSDDDLGDLTVVCGIAGTVLTTGGSVTCDVPELIEGNAGDVFAGTATIAATDDDGFALSASDDAATTLTDVLPTIVVEEYAAPSTLDEPGGDVVWTVEVTNTSVEPVTITSIADATYGELVGVGDCTAATLAVGGTYTCSYTAPVSGNATETIGAPVTVTATDDESNPASDDGLATVTLTDVLPSIVVEEYVTPGVLAEPGGAVTWTVTVANLSVEPVTLTSLVDQTHGDLVGKGDCALVTIAVGATYECSYGGGVLGNALDVFGAPVTAVAVDDEGNAATDDGLATVTLTDVPSSIAISKDVDVASQPEPGGDVVWTITVTNTSAVDAITLDTLSDDDLGDLTVVCGIAGTVLTTGGSVTCDVPELIEGNAGDVFAGTATIAATDDDGFALSASDDAATTLTDVPSSILVEKVADVATVAEPGGDVTWTVTITNTSTVDTVTLDTVVDSLQGDLLVGCGLDTLLAPGQSTTCSYTTFVGGDAFEFTTNTVAVTATDDDGQPLVGQAGDTVTIADVLPTIVVEEYAAPSTLDEPGGDVVWTVEVTNTSVEPVTITSIADVTYGELVGVGDCTAATLAVGGTYTCSYTAPVSGNATETIGAPVTVTATDDESNPASDDGLATVTLTDVPSSILVEKVADVATVAEPGGDVTWTVTITNTSTVDTVTLDTVVDSLQGDLLVGCGLDTLLAPGQSTTCSYTTFVGGDAFEFTTNTVAVTATDDDGQPLVGQAGDTVTIADVLPTLTLDKAADAVTVVSPGEVVGYTITITNTSPEDVTLTTLVDDEFGDLIDGGACAALDGEVLTPGATVTCAFDEFVGGLQGDVIDGNATVTGTDNEGNVATATDPEPVGVVVLGRGEVLHTGTTCEDFRIDTDNDLDQIEYVDKRGIITNAAPGVFFYYTSIVADSSSFSLDIVQQATSDYDALFEVNNGQVLVYDSECNRVDEVATVTNADGQVHIDFTDAVEGTEYVVSVKYSTSVLKSLLEPADGTATWSFSTYEDGNLAAQDGNGLLLISKDLLA